MTFPSRGDTSLSAWAHSYAEQGWPVFPLVPRAKNPLIRNGVLKASTDLGLVRRWWTWNPDANIGIATGFAFDVLDVDGPTAAQFLSKVWASLGVEYWHDGPVTRTGKGWHYLFAVTGSGNRANMGGTEDEPTKLDFRGRGGYIVGPPSVHPLGHRYEWLNGRGPDLALPAAPEWLGLLLNRDDNPRAKRPVLVKADPNKPALDYLELIASGHIPQDQVPRELRIRTGRPDILEVAARKGWPLRKGNGYYLVKCCFHDDSTPSMALYLHDNSFHCYGCGAHGDSLDLDRDPPEHM